MAYVLTGTAHRHDDQDVTVYVIVRLDDMLPVRKLPCGAPQAEFEQERARAEAANVAARAAAGMPATDAAAGAPPAQAADAGAKAGPSGSGEPRKLTKLLCSWLIMCIEVYKSFPWWVASSGNSSVHAGTASLGWGAKLWLVAVHVALLG